MNLIERMLQAAETAFTPLHSLIRVRSSHPGKWLFVVEGYEDVGFYQAQIQKIDHLLEFVPVVVKGKDNVLEVRKLIKGPGRQPDRQIAFFVDCDFDGLRGHDPGSDLYVTPCYSVENLCCTTQVFKSVMEGEFKLDPAEIAADLPKLVSIFDNRKQELLIALQDAHSLIFKSRTTGLPTISGIEDKVQKYVSVSTDLVVSIVDRPGICKLLGVKDPVCDADWTLGWHGYSKLDPNLFARGKFLHGFLVELLKKLKEDRCSPAPKYFRSRRSISFSPDTDQIRVYASCSPPTDCLRKFISGLSGPSLILS